MRDRNVGKVRIDDLYNLVIVIGQFLKLKIKLVVSSDELHFRRGASDDDELLGEDTFYNKSASIAGSVPGWAYDFPIFKSVTLQVNAGVQNIFDSYQDDFDKGAHRDAGYIYGPGIPRSYFVGCKISY